MKKNTLIIAIVSVLIISFLLFINKAKKQESKFVLSNNTTETKVVPEPLYDPVDRQDRIKDVLLTNGENYDKYSITESGDKNFIVTYFQRNKETENSSDLKLRRHEQGILLFKKQTDGIFKLLWESREEFFDPRYRLGLYDLTGDGVKEIILALNNDKGGAVMIYKYLSDSEINVITPYVDRTRPDGKNTKSIAFGADGGDTYIFDLDSDNIPEVIFPYNLRVGQTADNLNYEYKQVYRAYKWDGSKYFLWKEQETPFAINGAKSILEIIDDN